MTIDILLPCSDLTAAIEFYTKDLGFRLDVIFPADAPRVADLSGHGIQCRLERVSKLKQIRDDKWGTGRAGMEYRDLVPDRLGGRVIASHIRILKGGPVPDYVHHHHVEFQMIYCYKGWVKVVYEDQGPPFVMQAGDCVLQPPHIRHRVLECSDNMEVIEVSSPAEHETLLDHDMELPTSAVNTIRDFNGQRFVYHDARKATWQPGPCEGFESTDTGIEKATNSLASVQVIRPTNETAGTLPGNNGDLSFNFVLQGSTTLHRPSEAQQSLAAGDSFLVTAGKQSKLINSSKNLELLQVKSSLLDISFQLT